jgi:hypothetical protein
MAVNKVVFGGQTLIDLTADTITEERLLSGTTAHNQKGEAITGTCTFDSDTSDANVLESEILEGKSAYARGAKLDGKMKNNGAFTDYINDVNEEITIPVGFHDGSGKIGIDPVEKEKIRAEYIKQGQTILGVTGTMTGAESVKAEAKTITPSMAQQVITPSAGFDYLSQITVNAIPFETSENAAGGTTYSIG